MSDPISGTASTAASANAAAKRLSNLRPWPKGVSGNPGGRPKRQQALFDAIAGEFGGEGALTAMQREYSLTLRRSIELTATAANWPYSRGSTCICCVLDETAFFHNSEDSANSDEELLTALMPSLSTTSGPMLIASSPKDMQGIVYQLHRKHFGKDGDPRILVVQAAS